MMGLIRRVSLIPIWFRAYRRLLRFLLRWSIPKFTCISLFLSVHCLLCRLRRLFECAEGPFNLCGCACSRNDAFPNPSFLSGCWCVSPRNIQDPNEELKLLLYFRRKMNLAYLLRNEIIWGRWLYA